MLPAEVEKKRKCSNMPAQKSRENSVLHLPSTLCADCTPLLCQNLSLWALFSWIQAQSTKTGPWIFLQMEGTYLQMYERWWMATSGANQFALDNKNKCSILYCRVLKLYIIIVGHFLLVELPCISGSLKFSDPRPKCENLPDYTILILMPCWASCEEGPQYI